MSAHDHWNAHLHEALNWMAANRHTLMWAAKEDDEADQSATLADFDRAALRSARALLDRSEWISAWVRADFESVIYAVELASRNAATGSSHTRRLTMEAYLALDRAERRMAAELRHLGGRYGRGRSISERVQEWTMLAIELAHRRETRKSIERERSKIGL